MTFRMRVDYRIPSYKNASDKYRKQVKGVYLEGLKAYMRAIIDEVPVYSAESRASLAEAAKLVGVPIFLGPISPKAPSGGIAKGRAKGEASLTFRRGQFEFSHSSEVRHLDINNKVNVNLLYPQHFRLIKPGPYQLEAVGLSAYIRQTERGFSSASDSNPKRGGIAAAIKGFFRRIFGG